MKSLGYPYSYGDNLSEQEAKLRRKWFVFSLLNVLGIMPIYNIQKSSIMTPAPLVRFQVVDMDDYPSSGLYMEKMEHKYYISEYSESTIKEIRAGDSRVREAAWLLITIWMLHIRQNILHTSRHIFLVACRSCTWLP